MSPLDTTPEAYAVQLAIWRRMGPSGRHALVARMSEDLRELSRSGIRQRHPHWSASEVELELRRLMWGDALFRQVYPDYAAPAP
jgi:hypothetical protein